MSILNEVEIMNSVYMTRTKTFLKCNGKSIFAQILVWVILSISMLSCSTNEPKEAKSQSLNILIISVDNLGYGDLHLYNKNSPIKTPNIDHFATQGARLTGFYTASPTCTASRAALLTGRIPQRNQLDYQLSPDQNYGIGLRHSEILIPEIIKKGAPQYATGAFGKWNIGFAPGSRPTERGFDEFFGHVSGNIDYYSHFYRKTHDLYQNTDEIFRTGEYSTDLFANAAIDFIEKKSASSEPWFVYLPFNAPHFPNAASKAPGQANIWQAPDWAFAKAYGLSPDEPDPQKRYNAVVTALDHGIGNVLKALDSAGVAENTFVFLFSDNGAFRLGRPVDIGTNEPLREGGVTCWEGGLRVPAIVRWPGKVKANSVIDATLWTPDLLVASASLAGADLPKGILLDGKDPLPVLTGKTDVSPHEALFFQYRNHAAFRWKNWKIVRTNVDEPWQLFNIKVDLSESDNKAIGRPDLVVKLDSMFIAKQMEINKSNGIDNGI